MPARVLLPEMCWRCQTRGPFLLDARCALSARVLLNCEGGLVRGVRGACFRQFCTVWYFAVAQMAVRVSL